MCLADFAEQLKSLAKFERLRDRWNEAQADAPWRIAVHEDLKQVSGLGKLRTDLTRIEGPPMLGDWAYHM